MSCKCFLKQKVLCLMGYFLVSRRLSSEEEEAGLTLTSEQMTGSQIRSSLVESCGPWDAGQSGHDRGPCGTGNEARPGAMRQRD